MRVERFFPGRIRVSSPLFRKAEHVGSLRKALAGIPGIDFVEANLRIGSVTVVYDARSIAFETLMAAKEKIEAEERLAGIPS
jgi:hypothetical protein